LRYTSHCAVAGAECSMNDSIAVWRDLVASDTFPHIAQWLRCPQRPTAECMPGTPGWPSCIMPQARTSWSLVGIIRGGGAFFITTAFPVHRCRRCSSEYHALLFRYAGEYLGCAYQVGKRLHWITPQVEAQFNQGVANTSCPVFS
jgi:hypothetical protein